VAFDQALCPILKRIRQWVRADVAHRKRIALLLEDKIHFTAEVLNRARLDVSPDANTLVARVSLKGRELRDRMVVRLALARSDPGQTGKRHKDDDRANRKLRLGLHNSPETLVPVDSNTEN